MKAMILAAGKGTRLMPLTADKPKVLVEIQGVPLLQHTIQYLKYYGITDIIINIHHFAKQVIDFIAKNNDFGINIEFSDESDALLDTGGGLYKARHFFNKEPFVLTSSDVITDMNLSEMIEFHKQHEPLVTLAVKKRNSTRDFIFDQNMRLCGWHNNITGDTKLVRDAADTQKRLGFSTIHVINPVIFDLITERGSFSIIDLYLRLTTQYPVIGFEHNESDWFECGKIETLNLLNQNPEIDTIYKKYHKL
jgi:NDP-sugar pyrophosphorylase family protein